jgi:hypothetical protein
VPHYGGVRYRQFIILSVARSDLATLAEVSGGFCYSNSYQKKKICFTLLAIT